MSQTNYSPLITERIHEGLNFNRNHRLFLVYGKLTADEFLTRSLYRATLRETLWATLKENKIERVIFYNAAEKFFFLDAESVRLAERLGRPDQPPPGTSASSSSRMQAGPLGNRNVLNRPARMVAPASSGAAAQPAADNPAAASPAVSDAARSRGLTPPGRGGSEPADGIIRMSRSRGQGTAMSDAAVLTTFDDFMRDDSVRTAIVIEDLENLSDLDRRVRDPFAARLTEWNSLKSQNRNVLVFVTNREPGDEQSADAMRQISSQFPEIANLINIAVGEGKAETEGFIWYVPPPYEPEIGRLIDELRLKHGVAVDWKHRDQTVRWLAAENREFRTLDGRFKECVARMREAGEIIGPETLRRRELVEGNPDPRPAMERLAQMIGMEKIKGRIRKQVNWLKVEKARREQHSGGLASPPLNLHLVLTGNPGTGKTTVARLIGELYRDIGLLRRGHTVECGREHLVAGYEGQTAPKINSRVNEALDGVLFIDEAYHLKREGEDPFGEEAVTTLVRRMENERHRLAVIVAGYPAEMEKFISSNPGLPGRFPTTIHLEDYSPADLMLIFEQMIGQRGFAINDETRATMRGLLARMYEMREDKKYFPPEDRYRNAGTVRNLVEGMAQEQADRLGGTLSTELTVADIPDKFRRFLGGVRQGEGGEAELAGLMKELDDLVGLHPVKEFVRRLVIEQQLAIRLKRDVSATGKTRHMLFTGNPGTGKTTVARLVGRIYRCLGLLKGDQLIEAQRSDLVGQYLGETAQKTNAVIQRALDGVLFIDEAYSLTHDARDPYGREAINTLVPALENYRDRLVVILAGYTLEMQGFLAANSGIRSRIGHSIEFPDYTADELLEIFMGMAAQGGYAVPDDVRDELRRQFGCFSANPAQPFDNGRDVRVRFYEKMVEGVEGRMYEAVIVNGQDAEDFPRAFVLADVPSVAPGGPLPSAASAQRRQAVGTGPEGMADPFGEVVGQPRERRS